MVNLRQIVSRDFAVCPLVRREWRNRFALQSSFLTNDQTVKVCQKQRMFLALVNSVCTAHLKSRFFGEPLRHIISFVQLTLHSLRIIAISSSNDVGITDFSLLSSNTPASTACSQTFIMHFFQQHPTIKSNHSSSNSSPAIFFRSSIYAHVRFNDSNASLVLANSPSNNSFHRLSTVFCFIPIAGFSINESKPSLIKFFSHSLAS